MRLAKAFLIGLFSRPTITGRNVYPKLPFVAVIALVLSVFAQVGAIVAPWML